MDRLIELKTDLDRIAAGYSGKVTYALTDLTSGGHIGVDEDAPMPPASLLGDLGYAAWTRLAARVE
ncbi:MAG: hypothetical protein HY723_05380 [Chloroflexi bacterium]|nr:hypothetical protein [Chloroflexota bacterium]